MRGECKKGEWRSMQGECKNDCRKGECREVTKEDVLSFGMRLTRFGKVSFLLTDSEYYLKIRLCMIFSWKIPKNTKNEDRI